MQLKQSKPFQFKSTPKNRHKQISYKYYRHQALNKIKDKKRARRQVKLRRIHLNRYISVKYNGNKWWNKLMNIHYAHLTREEILNIRQNTTSEVILQFQQIRTKTHSYIDTFVYRQIPSLVQENHLKFILHGIPVNQQLEQEDQEDEDKYELVVYKAEENKESYSFEECYISDPDSASLAPCQKLSTIRVNNIERELDMRGQYRINATLNYVESITDPQILYECLLYQQRLRKHKYSHINCQLSLLPSKLEQIHEENMNLWDRVIQQYDKEVQILKHLSESCQEVNGLQLQLACKQRLLYFRKGFSDKTEDELEQALQELELEEKRLIFSRRVKKVNRLASYNDCKICFNPEVKQDNLILFCSLCHTSFHINCYGYHTASQSQTYVCDACLWMQENDFQDDSLRPQCSICFSRKQFPLKRIGEVFYHVTCLFFFKLANVQSLPITLKQSQEMITEGNQQEKRCNYCLPEEKNKGLLLCCTFCHLKFHPICGYLRGCKFHLERPYELQVRASCHIHTYNGNEQDEIRQVYIRRFFCNFQNIQPLTEQQFKPIYSNQKHRIEIQRRKLQKVQQSWEEYETMRKRTKEIQQQEYLYLQYKSMSIEQLLSLNAQEEGPEEEGNNGEVEEEMNTEEESSSVQEVQQLQEINFIVID